LGLSGIVVKQLYVFAIATRCKKLNYLLNIEQMSQVERPVLAIDRTAWLRPHAPTLKELQHRPIVLFDNEYGCAPLVKATAAIAADKLMRIRSNRCLWSAPLFSTQFMLSQFVLSLNSNLSLSTSKHPLLTLFFALCTLCGSFIPKKRGAIAPPKSFMSAF